MLGFMLPTFFLSMWISNNATTAMMMPILEAVLLEMEGKNSDSRRGVVEEVMEIGSIKEVDIDSDSGEIREDINEDYIESVKEGWLLYNKFV